MQVDVTFKMASVCTTGFMITTVLPSIDAENLFECLDLIPTSFHDILMLLKAMSRDIRRCATHKVLYSDAPAR